MTTEAAKAAKWLRQNFVGTKPERAMAELTATLLDQQAEVLEEQRRVLDDQAREILELRALIKSARAVLEPNWSIGG